MVIFAIRLLIELLSIEWTKLAKLASFNELNFILLINICFSDNF